MPICGRILIVELKTFMTDVFFALFRLVITTYSIVSLKDILYLSKFVLIISGTANK